jgi:Peptidase family S51
MESLPRILLISNSTVYGRDYLDHVEQQIKSFLGSARKVLFFPFALFDRDTYAAKAKARFAVMGYSIETAHAVSDPHQAHRADGCDLHRWRQYVSLAEGATRSRPTGPDSPESKTRCALHRQ